MLKTTLVKENEQERLAYAEMLLFRTMQNSLRASGRSLTWQSAVRVCNRPSAMDCRSMGCRFCAVTCEWCAEKSGRPDHYPLFYLAAFSVYQIY